MSRPEQHLEVERKYATGPGARMPDLEGLGTVDAPRVDALDAVYYDTPDLRVLGARCTLRRRTGGEDAGWHLKTPGDGAARGEARLPVGSEGRVPEPLRERLAGVVGDAPLLPIVRLRTRRTSRRLVTEEGRATIRAELSFDEVRARVLRRDAGARRSWTEAEVELAEGEQASTLDAIGARFEAAGYRPAGYVSKLAHALAGVGPASAPEFASPAAETVLWAIAGRFGEFQALEPGIREDAPDSVHQARIALRRIRSIIRVYRRMFCRDRADEVCALVRWAGLEVGAVRGAGVLIAELRQHLDALAREEGETAIAPIRRRAELDLAAKHDGALRRCLEAMDSDRWNALHRTIVAFLVDPPVSKAGRREAAATLPGLAARAEHRVERRYNAALLEPEVRDRWHDVRKAAKAVRYAAEVVAAVPGADPAWAQSVRTWKSIASAFGTVQDSVILDEATIALREAARAEGEDAAPYLALHDRLEAARAEQLAGARARLARALRPSGALPEVGPGRGAAEDSATR